ncbi:MAG: MBL fold metallo-hydrolase [Oscillospiraceae bacterium]|nr:MBL fold metallo-hydrolase [Oscillospiraceae bacterium]
MKIHIHRGQDQIGGSIIEISTDNTRLIFDVGAELDESEEIEIPPIDGLFVGIKKYDAVFVSHYHPDHIGLLGELVDGIPVYMGEKAFGILHSAYSYRKLDVPFSPQSIHDGQTVQIGDITITPLLCDHSAFDSYMFLVEAEGKRVLYTGDFRANGRLDFDKLLDRLPKVDAVIIEGTTLSRDDNICNIEEETLEEIAVNYLEKHSGPAFIMMSAMNIDRLKTIENVARRTDRLLLEDLYTARVATASGCAVPDRKNVIRVFMTKGDSEYAELFSYGSAKIGKSGIARVPFIMCVRSSMRRYLENLCKLISFEGGVLFYGMWKGYMEQSKTKEFIEFMQSKGVKIHILHTSGHADSMTIDKLIQRVEPKIIAPVHTENSEWFEKYKIAASIANESEVEL